MQLTKHILFAGLVLLISGAVSAQEDTSKRKSIDIISTFKPVLREPAKVNFNAAPVIGDTTPPRLKYDIPAENLLFTYQPAALKPLALNVDSTSDWISNNYIKVGVGNVHLPYIKAGFSLGDGENSFVNVFGEHYSSKGDEPFQENSMTKVGATLTYKTENNLEWNAGLGFSSDNYFLYGYEPETLNFSKDDLRQRFQTIEGRLGLKNIKPTEFGLNFNPTIRASLFTDNHDPRASEFNTVVNLPLEKEIGSTTSFRLGLNADLTNYQNDAAIKTPENNYVFMVSPTLVLKTTSLYLQAGVIPSWDRSEFHMLPNVMADITTSDQRFTVQLGWIGYYNKGSYQRFASINPWLAQPDSLLNTRVQEGYFGFKGSAGDHFSYSAKLGYQWHREMPLFVNNPVDGKDFDILYESKLNIFQSHVEAEYRVGEKFSAKAVANWNIFKIQDQPEAWGLIPIELTTTARWQLIKDLFLRVDLLTWDGPQYRTKTGEAFKNQGGFDLNAGAEFRITKNFNLWFQMNNILNNNYQRWNQYDVFGFNILGGVTYSFTR